VEPPLLICRSGGADRRGSARSAAGRVNGTTYVKVGSSLKRLFIYWLPFVETYDFLTDWPAGTRDLPGEGGCACPRGRPPAPSSGGVPPRLGGADSHPRPAVPKRGFLGPCPGNPRKGGFSGIFPKNPVFRGFGPPGPRGALGPLPGTAGPARGPLPGPGTPPPEEGLGWSPRS